jgi:hypothetical protein
MLPPDKGVLAACQRPHHALTRSLNEAMQLLVKLSLARFSAISSSHCGACASLLDAAPVTTVFSGESKHCLCNLLTIILDPFRSVSLSETSREVGHTFLL